MEVQYGDLVDVIVSEKLAREKGIGRLLTGTIEEVRDRAIKIRGRTVLKAQANGSCRLCGHPITKPASMAIGYGPDCSLLLGITNKLIANWESIPSPKQMQAVERAVTGTWWLPKGMIQIYPAGQISNDGKLKPRSEQRKSDSQGLGISQVGLFDQAKASIEGDQLPLWIRCTASGKELFPYQEEGVKRAIALGQVLLADEPGLGKTSQAIGYAKLAQSTMRETGDFGPVVVVCPANLKLNWKAELADWWPDARVQVLKGYSAKLDPKAQIFIVNYDILAKGWKKNPKTGKKMKGAVELSQTTQGILSRSPSVLLVDESHYVKDPASQRGLALKDLAMVASYVLPMTGTPMLNRPVELVPLLDLINELDSRFGGEDQFKQRYCGAKTIEVPLRKKVPDGKGGTFLKEITRDKKDANGNFVVDPETGLRVKEPVMLTVSTFNGASNTHELFEKLAPIMIRRRKREVLTDLPPKMYSRVLCELSNQADIDAYEQEILDAPASQKLGMLGKLRSMVSVGKQRDTVEWIKTFLDGSDEKLVVFAQFRAMQQAIAAEFPEAVTIFGGMTDANRHAAVKKFQDDPEIRLVICSLQAAAEGITLTASSNELVADLDYVPGKLLQANDRIDRIREQRFQTDSIMIWTMWAEGSLDDTMGATLFDKRVVTGESIDGVPHLVDEEAVKASALREVLARAAAKRGKVRAKAS